MESSNAGEELASRLNEIVGPLGPYPHTPSEPPPPRRRSEPLLIKDSEHTEYRLARSWWSSLLGPCLVTREFRASYPPGEREEWTVWKLEVDGKRSEEERFQSREEVEEWLWDAKDEEPEP